MAGESKLGVAQVPIRATLDDLDKDLSTAKQRLEGGIGGIAKGLSGALGGILPTLIPVAAITGTVAVGFKKLKEAIGAAKEEQVGVGQLAGAIRATGVEWESVEGEIEGYIAAQSRRVALDDGEGREALKNLTFATNDYRRAMDLMPLTMDLAAGKQMSLANAAEIVGKVAQGNVGILTRYGIQMEKGATAGEALAEMQSRFAGQAEAYGQSLEGAEKRTDIAVGNIMETIGGAFLPVLTTLKLQLAEKLEDMLPTIEAFAERAGVALSGFVDKAMPIIDQGLKLLMGEIDWEQFWKPLWEGHYTLDEAGLPQFQPGLRERVWDPEEMWQDLGISQETGDRILEEIQAIREHGLGVWMKEKFEPAYGEAGVLEGMSQSDIMRAAYPGGNVFGLQVGGPAPVVPEETLREDPGSIFTRLFTGKISPGQIMEMAFPWGRADWQPQQNQWFQRGESGNIIPTGGFDVLEALKLDLSETYERDVEGRIVPRADVLAQEERRAEETVTLAELVAGIGDLIAFIKGNPPGVTVQRMTVEAEVDTRSRRAGGADDAIVKGLREAGYLP